MFLLAILQTLAIAVPHLHGQEGLKMKGFIQFLDEKIHPPIHFIPLCPFRGYVGCRSLSRLTLGERQGMSWMSDEKIFCLLKVEWKMKTGMLFLFSRVSPV